MKHKVATQVGVCTTHINNLYFKDIKRVRKKHKITFCEETSLTLFISNVLLHFSITLDLYGLLHSSVLERIESILSIKESLLMISQPGLPTLP